MFISFNMNPITDLLLKNIQIFQFFTGTYIFGSVVKNHHFSNDIDILLIYDQYLNQIQSEKDNICSFLQKVFDLPIDLTILSEQELLETKFLEKIGTYERLK